MSYRVQGDVLQRPGNDEVAALPREVDEAEAQGASHINSIASEKTPLLESDIKTCSRTWSVYVLTCIVALGGFLFGYDTGVISGALLPLTRLFHLDDLWKELVVSSTVGAAIVGAISGGWFNDKFGRKLVLIISSVIFTSGAVIMAVASEKEILLTGRLVVGVAVGKNTNFI